MALGLTALFLLVGGAQAGFDYPFCTTGISKANFSENEPVEVIFAQAPLFSTNPSIGDKGKYFNLYHTCIVLAQGAGSSRRYWTLEFDFAGGSILQSIVPQFQSTGFPMVWHNNARYCLTEGVLWGEEHWSKSFRILFAVTPAQIQQTFTDFVGSVNTSTPDTKPQYQLWRVAKKWPDSEMLVQDSTCSDGVLWFLHDLTSVHNVMLPPDFEFRATVVRLNAERVVAIDKNDKQKVDNMVVFFKIMSDLISANKSIAHRLLDVLELGLGGRKYVYDTNSEVYYELSGNRLPWISFEYASYSIMGPPWRLPTTTPDRKSVV